MTREEAQEFLTALGAKVSNSVSKNTDYLIVGDKPSRSKIEKARKLGVTIITEDQLIDMLNAKAKNKQARA